MVFAFMLYSPAYGRDDIEGGRFNGYVAFDADMYPMTSKNEYEDELCQKIKVHGGVTFNRYMDCLMDVPLLPLTSIPNIEFLYTSRYRVIGFDTLHADDTKDEWTLSRTKEETMKMYDQVLTEIMNRNVLK